MSFYFIYKIEYDILKFFTRKNIEILEKTNKILRAWHRMLIKAMQIAVELQNDLEGFLYTTLDIFAEQLGKDNLM